MIILFILGEKTPEMEGAQEKKREKKEGAK